MDNVYKTYDHNICQNSNSNPIQYGVGQNKMSKYQETFPQITITSTHTVSQSFPVYKYVCGVNDIYQLPRNRTSDRDLSMDISFQVFRLGNVQDKKQNKKAKIGRWSSLYMLKMQL